MEVEYCFIDETEYKSLMQYGQERWGMEDCLRQFRTGILYEVIEDEELHAVDPSSR